MELYAFDYEFLMTNCHNFVIIKRLRSDFQAIWDRVRVCNKRMVARSFEGVGNVLKENVLRVSYSTSLTMPYLASIYDLASKGVYYSLMPEANSQDWNVGTHLSYDIGADSKVLAISGMARA